MCLCTHAYSCMCMDVLPLLGRTPTNIPDPFSLALFSPSCPPTISHCLLPIIVIKSSLCGGALQLSSYVLHCSWLSPQDYIVCNHISIQEVQSSIQEVRNKIDSDKIVLFLIHLFDLIQQCFFFFLSFHRGRLDEQDVLLLFFGYVIS